MATREGFTAVEAILFKMLDYHDDHCGLHKVFMPLTVSEKVRGLAIDRETWHYRLSEDGNISHSAAFIRLSMEEDYRSLSVEERLRRFLQGYVVPLEGWNYP